MSKPECFCGHPVRRHDYDNEFPGCPSCGCSLTPFDAAQMLARAEVADFAAKWFRTEMLDGGGGAYWGDRFANTIREGYEP